MRSSFLTLAAAAGLIASSAMAAQRSVVFSSDKDRLVVESYGGADRCASPMRFRMILGSGSPLAGSAAGQISAMNRLKKRILHDCPAAASAEITVNGVGATGGVFRATAANGWIFALVAPTPASPPAVASRAQPSPFPDLSLPPEPAANGASGSTPAPSDMPDIPEPPNPPSAASSAAPAPAASAGVAAASQPPSPSPVAPPPHAATDATGPAPREIGYASALLAYLQVKPEMARNDGVVRWWASYRYPNEYFQVKYQEFKLQPLLDRASRDLAETIKRNDGRLVTALLASEIESYDFQTRRFPLKLKGDEIHLNNNDVFAAGGAPGGFTIETRDLDLIDGVPMDRASAESFAEKRTQYGRMNRGIYIAATLRLDGREFTPNGYADQMKTSGALESVVVYGDKQGAQPIYRLGATEIEAMRKERAARIEAEKKAEAARLAEQRRQEALAARASTIRSLAASPAEVRLANWISALPISLDVRLDDLRSARGAALGGGAPFKVRMLIQAKSGGRSGVATVWPGHLKIDVPEQTPALEPDRWYLVRGDFSVPEEKGLPDARLSAVDLYACAKPQCADATDVEALVDRNAAAASAALSSVHWPPANGQEADGGAGARAPSARSR